MPCFILGGNSTSTLPSLHTHTHTHTRACAIPGCDVKYISSWDVCSKNWKHCTRPPLFVHSVTSLFFHSSVCSPHLPNAFYVPGPELRHRQIWTQCPQILNWMSPSAVHLFRCEFILHSLLSCPTSLLSLPWITHAVLCVRGLRKTLLVSLSCLWAADASAKDSFPYPQRLALVLEVILFYF